MEMKLRQHAEERLKGGTAPPMRGWTTSTQALSMLHGLASNPEGASDALKLLHELQVHQVALDLQHEQADQDRLQLSEDLKRYTDHFDLAPFGYLTLDPEGLVTAANRVATDWLAAKTDEAQEWESRRIEDLVAPESRLTIQGMLAGLRKGEGRQSCALQSRSGGISAQVVMTAAPGDEQLRGGWPSCRSSPDQSAEVLRKRFATVGLGTDRATPRHGCLVNLRCDVPTLGCCACRGDRCFGGRA